MYDFTMMTSEQCVRMADNMTGGFTIGDVRLNQRWQSWKFCARSTEQDVRTAMENAQCALFVPGNRIGTYRTRLETMVEVYVEYLKGT